ncbi:MSCRAMM family protein, partial [Macrococcus capreoli]|uniref:MSCRAMM family protein n=1 Tax=Macrococcus capreoli TaxID=2982690 RepID=UPI003EE63796
PTTEKPTTEKPTTEKPTTEKPTTEEPTTEEPTTEKPTTEKPTTEKPTTEEPTTEKPTTEKPTTEEPTTEKPTTEKPTTEAPTTEKPVQTGSITITKVDSENASTVLAGAEFNLMQDGKVVKANLVSNQNGVVEIKDLPFGTYELVETKAPNGYVKSDTSVKVTISEASPAFKVVFKNAKAAEEKVIGKIVVTKVDSENGKVLPGATFNLVQNNQVVKSNLVTNNQGQIIIDNLEAGNYQLVETKAPAGYLKSDQPMNISITKEKSSYEVKVPNKKISGTLKVIKTDESGNKVLPGAVFNLVKDGQVIKSNLTSDAQGVIVVPNLEEGAYQLVE